MPGGFFLEAHWDRRFGDDRHVGTSIIRYDAASREYSAFNVDNLGYARTYRMTERDGVWSLAGPRERATIRFADDGATMQTHWDVKRDGERWAPLCDLVGTRV